MAVMDLYPKDLQDLNLSFEEAIYAIAFGLEDEIYRYGKEEVFEKLGVSEAEMTKRVEYCLDEVMYEPNAYALRRVLGDLDSPDRDKRIFEQFGSLRNGFYDVVQRLKAPTTEYSRKGAVNYRYLLAKGANSEGEMKTRELEEAMPSSENELTEHLYIQVQQLMDEVRVYDEKRALALDRIEALLTEIKQRQDCPVNFGRGYFGCKPGEVTPDDAVMRIGWPYRSANILREFGFTTLEEVVEYFRDFNHFIEDGETTLLEWWVIVTILRQAGLLPAVKTYEKFGLSDKVGGLELSIRTYNALVRTGIDDIDDVIMMFADGIEEGRYNIRTIRNMGVKSQYELFCRLGEVVIELDDSICFPMKESHIQALDFNRKDRRKLLRYKINTVGDLLVACQDENRFSGLRHIDNNFYQTAMARLTEYGFVQ